MKKITSVIILLALNLLVLKTTRAQGTVFLSSLTQPSSGSMAVGSNSWLGVLFVTGYNSGGYVLNSVQLTMTAANANPDDFSVMLYAASYAGGGIFPASSSLSVLAGSTNPAIAGTYTYTPTSNIILSADTDYFIMLTAGTSTNTGAYELSFTSTSPNHSGSDWGQYGILYSSSNDSFWNLGGTGNYFQFAIGATAVPEPSSAGLILFGFGMFICFRNGFLHQQVDSKSLAVS